MSEPMLKTIQITICEPCLAGIGEECHTPGCALFLHRVDLPIHPDLYEVVAEFPVADRMPPVSTTIAEAR